MANKIKTNPETPIYFLPSGTTLPGSGILAYFDVRQMPQGSGWQSNRYDLGPGPRTSLYEWRAKVTNVVAYSTYPVEFYIATSDGNTVDGTIGVAESVVTNPNKLRNMMCIGAISSDNSTGQYQTSGLCEIYARYINIVWWNNSSSTLGSGSTDNMFILTPVPDEIQSS